MISNERTVGGAMTSSNVLQGEISDITKAFVGALDHCCLRSKKVGVVAKPYRISTKI